MNVDFDQQDIIIELPPEGKDGRSIHPAGEWSADAEYHTLDLVSYNGSSYIAERSVPAGTLPTDAEYWQVVAEKGASEWGNIAGNIADQTDLQDALNSKADADSVYTKTETDALLADKADTDDVYSKTEVNTLLSRKADADTVYTKTETDTLLDAKADVGDSYTKAEEDALLAVKANSADVYTKAQTDTLLADKADADTVYTKTETDSLLSNKADSDSVYTKDEVDDALADKADSADVYTKTETDDALLAKAPVILSNASGSIASFTDGSPAPVTALSVSIEPVQDLHGYDAPWPAGGGKNKMPLPVAETKSGVTLVRNSNGSLTLSGANTTSTPVYFDFFAGDFDSTAFAGYIFKATSTYNTWGSSSVSFRVSTSNRVAIKEFWGNIEYTIEDNGSGLYFAIRVTGNYTIPSGGITIYPMLRASTETDTFAPYSNICPISGRTSATVTRTGKNLCDQSAVTLGMLTESNGIYSASDADTRSTLYFKLNQYNGDTYIPNSAVVSSAITSVGKISLTTTILSGCTKLQFRNAGFAHEFYFSIPITPLMWGKQVTFSAYILDKTIGAVKFTEPQLELGQTASDYLPYQPIQALTIDLDGTRYGGVIDVLTGEMTVTHALNVIDGNSTVSKNGTLPSGGAQIGYKPNPEKAYSYPTNISEILSDTFKPYASYNAFDMQARTNNRWVYFNFTPDITTSEQASAWFAQNPTQIWYKLATPLTVQLTPSQLSTLLGQNNIWADTGNVAVEYRADTKRYIDSKFSQLQALILEN